MILIWTDAVFLDLFTTSLYQNYKRCFGKLTESDSGEKNQNIKKLVKSIQDFGMTWPQLGRTFWQFKKS